MAKIVYCVSMIGADGYASKTICYNEVSLRMQVKNAMKDRNDLVMVTVYREEQTLDKYIGCPYTVRVMLGHVVLRNRLPDPPLKKIFCGSGPDWEFFPQKMC